MNSDIRVKTTFPNHHKTKKLRRRLGCDGICALMFLWLFAAENRPDGVLSGMDEEDIAIAAQWEGDATSMLQALLELGFLELGAGGEYIIHDWYDNNTWAANAGARSDKAKKAAAARWEKKLGNAPKEEEKHDAMLNDATSIENADLGNAPKPLPSPSPSPLPSNNNNTRTETEIRFIATFDEKEANIKKLYPHADYEAEKETCIAQYRNNASAGLDPYPVILKWFNRIPKGDKHGLTSTRHSNAARTGQAARNAPSLTDSLTEDFCSR